MEITVRLQSSEPATGKFLKALQSVIETSGASMETQEGGVDEYYARSLEMLTFFEKNGPCPLDKTWTLNRRVYADPRGAGGFYASGYVSWSDEKYKLAEKGRQRLAELRKRFPNWKSKLGL